MRGDTTAGVGWTLFVVGTSLPPQDIAQQWLDYRRALRGCVPHGCALTARCDITFVEFKPFAQCRRHVVVAEGALVGVAQNGLCRVIASYYHKAVAIGTIEHIIWRMGGSRHALSLDALPGRSCLLQRALPAESCC